MPDARRHALYQRLCRYSGRALIFAADLPATRLGRHLEDQLARSSTAAGAHYAEAQGAQSPADFVHKLSLSLKEARESLYWVHVAVEAEMEGRHRDWLADEGDQLVAMLQAAQTTALRNQKERGR